MSRLSRDPSCLLAMIAAAIPLLGALQAARAQDAAAGGMSFMQCSECHSETASNGAGPGLKGVVGRKAGTLDGFGYSGPMKASGIKWDARSLDAFLADPQKAVPGSTMVFAGIADPAERANVVAYLASLK